MFDLGRSFLASVERRPQATAIADGALHKSYETWFRDIQSVAHALEGFGLSKGDRLLVIMQNRWQMATLHWACQFAGIIVTPVNWRSTAQDLEFFITDTEARVVAYDESACEAVHGCSSAQSLVRITSGQIEDPDAHDFDSLLDNRGDTILRATVEDISLMLYTSGTSGKPKGVPRLHRAERSAALAHVAQNLYRHNECTLGVMPLYHTM